MYTVSSAARMSQGWLLRESWNALAVPWKLPRIVDGTPIRASALSIAIVAWPSDVPSGRLNEIVVATNCD